jgi:hypothetical protein
MQTQQFVCVKLKVCGKDDGWGVGLAWRIGTGHGDEGNEDGGSKESGVGTSVVVCG